MRSVQLHCVSLSSGWCRQAFGPMHRPSGTSSERVGEYALREIIGAGSFGQVFLGVHVKQQTRVAIKALPKFANDRHTIARVSNEVSNMEKAHVGCPFILRLYEVLLDRSKIYLVVEYAGGGELFKACFKMRSEPDTDVGTSSREQRARRYFQQLVIGLHWCHQQGVVHRDLKPQNLLLSLDGVLKIADFGLAAGFNPDEQPHARSLRHTICGSPLYMAPEMLALRSGESYNAIPTDVWGCGAVLHAMLLGEPPFPANSFSELTFLASHSNAHLRLPDRMSRALQALMRSLLHSDPKVRFTLPQVAQHPWFQTSLRDTLARTPGFIPPEDMMPIGGIRPSSQSAGVALPTATACGTAPRRTSPLVVVLKTPSSMARLVAKFQPRPRHRVSPRPDPIGFSGARVQADPEAVHKGRDDAEGDKSGDLKQRQTSASPSSCEQAPTATGQSRRLKRWFG